MAVDSTIKRKTASGSGYDIIHPKTNKEQVEGLATALANITIDSLDDIADVNAPSPSDGQALVWNNSTSKWIAADSTTLTSLGITATAAELNKMDGVTATTTEINYIDGVTSAIQTQLDGKQGTITGGASTITGSNLTASRALVSNSSGKVAVSAVTSTELGYLDGVTSAIQTQLDAKAPLASPALTGTPTAPTANSGTNTTQIATTAFVQNALTGVSGGLNFAGSISLSGGKNGDQLAAAGLSGPGDYLIVTTAGDLVAGGTFVNTVVQPPGDEGDSTLPVTLEVGDWIVYVSGDSGAGTMTVAIINNTDTRFAPTVHTHTIANVTGLQTALDGKVAKAGDTMTGALQMPATVAHPGNSAPTALAYGKLTGYGSFHINADTDGTTTEFLYLTAGYGQGAGTSNEGLRIGHAESSLTWKGHRVFTDNYHPNADTWTTARTLTIGSTGKSVNGSGNVSWTLAEIGAAPASHTHAYLPLSGGTLTGTLTSRAINMQNYDITGINALSFNDPGPNEGISWSGGNFRIYESPNDLTTNTSGNLQFVSGGVRRMTISTGGNVDVPGNISTTLLDLSGYPLQVSSGNLLYDGDTVWHEGNFNPGSYLTTSGKAADANLLDGIDSASFLRSDADDTLTATLYVDSTQGGSIAYIDSGGTYIPRPSNASYKTTTADITGALTVRLPGAIPNDMLSFWVDVMDYAGNPEGESVSIYVYGYAYTTSSPFWTNVGALILSDRTDRDYNVRFGYDGTNHVVCVGETTSTWNYPQVIVRDFQAGYSASASTFDDGWSITFLTTLPSIGQTASNNYPVAKQLEIARNIALTGAVTGNANFDGSGNISIATTHTADPVITLTGAVTGSGTMTNLGSVSIATTATADPTLTLTGDATGSATFTNLGNATLTVAVVDDSHNHIISNVDGLQTALDGKLSTSGKAADADKLDGYDWMQSGKSVRGTEFYADNWFRNYNANEGLYNEATQAHWMSRGAGNWTAYTTASATEIRFETSGGARRGSVYADNGNNIGFLDEVGAWSLRMDNGNTANFTGSAVVNGDLYGRAVNASWSNLYRWGGIYFTWDSDEYGSNTHHSIRSTYGDSYQDALTMNSFNHIRFNIDSNNNNSGSVFEVGRDTTGTGNVIFQVNDSGNVFWTGTLTGGTVPWARVSGAPGFVTSSGVTSVATGGGLTGGTITSTGTISHADTSSAANLTASGRRYVTGLTFDTYGHVTGYSTGTETVVNTNTTYTAGGGLTLSGTQFSHTDTSSQGSINNSGNTFIQDITLDTYGHITGIVSATANNVGNADTVDGFHAVAFVRNVYSEFLDLAFPAAPLTIATTAWTKPAGTPSVTLEANSRYYVFCAGSYYTSAATTGMGVSPTFSAVSGNIRGGQIFINTSTTTTAGTSEFTANWRTLSTSAGQTGNFALGTAGPTTLPGNEFGFYGIVETSGTSTVLSMHFRSEVGAGQTVRVNRVALTAMKLPI